MVNGRAEVVDAEADIQRLGLRMSRLDVYPWVTDVRHPFWIRIRPTSVSGRKLTRDEVGIPPGWLKLAASRSGRLIAEPQPRPGLRRASDELASRRP